MPTYKFDPLKETGLTIEDASQRKKAMRAVADFVKEQALLYIGDGTSPIAGGKWKRSLSPAYKAEKAKISSADFANLELSGDMLDALSTKVHDEEIEYGIPDSSTQAEKADGNNRGTYGHRNKTNRKAAREFIPRGDQTFKRDIWNGIEDIIKNHGGE